MKVILFDLDGTLLCFDKKTFTKNYFTCLTNFLKPYGYEPEKLLNTVLNGTIQMKNNNGIKTNEEVFWRIFEDAYGKEALKDRKIFDEFYAKYFDEINNKDRKKQEIVKVIFQLKKMGYKLVVASNPLFPIEAQRKRVEWAGLNADDFDFITSYESMHYSKPNIKFYSELLQKLKVDSKDCLMVGNDVTEDMVASKLGMKVFLLTEFLENKNNLDISSYNSGDFNGLLTFVINNF